MGQYYKVFNLSSHEKVTPHNMGDGTKLMEFGSSSAGTLSAMAMLMAAGANERGPWAGARLVVGGDYADEGRFVPTEFAKTNLYTYDYGYPPGGEEALPPGTQVGDRFKDVCTEARARAASHLPPTHPFNQGTSNLGTALFDKSAVVESADALFDLFDVAVCEPFHETFESMKRQLWCAEIPSALSWSSTARRATVVLTKDKDDIASMTVVHQERGDDKSPLETIKKISFPATMARVRSFMGITVKTLPEKRRML